MTIYDVLMKGKERIKKNDRVILGEIMKALFCYDDFPETIEFEIKESLGDIYIEPLNDYLDGALVSIKGYSCYPTENSFKYRFYLIKNCF